MQNKLNKTILKQVNNGKITPESGRSMVEMLGTLAIMGALSVGAIGGYSYAMNKHRTNELIYEATKRAQWVGTQLELGSDPSLNTFGTDSFGFGSFSGIDNNLPNANQFGIQVSDLNQSVCDNLVNHLERTGVIRDVTNVDCQAGTATLVFNRDLSTSDSEVPSVEPEVSGEASASAGAVTEPATQDPDDVHCSGNGSWNGSSCYCDPDWDGDSCSERNDEPESSESAGYEPEETATAQSGEDHSCSGHGTWYGDYCYCNDDYAGSDCSQTSATVCGPNGFWESLLGACECNSGYGGTDCSIENPCDGHGTWYNTYNSHYCSCDSGWGGSDCSIEIDINDPCSGHGTYNGSSCACDSGWSGDDCSCYARDFYCNGHGTFLSTGACQCDIGWYGYYCAAQDVRAACGNIGTWTGSTCECDDPTVASPYCPTGPGRTRIPTSCRN